MSEASKTPVIEFHSAGYFHPDAIVCSAKEAERLAAEVTEALRVGDDLLKLYNGALDRAQRAEAALSTAVFLSDFQTVVRRDYLEQQSSEIAELEKDATRLDWWGGDIRNAIDKAMAEGKPARAILASSGQGATESSS